jgi:hypothetical protein
MKKSEIYKNAIEAVIGSYEGSEKDFETLSTLFSQYFSEKFMEEKGGEDNE